jgi:hypothetical protein
MQALRGAVYLNEGNVKPHQLSSDGRHVTPEDESSWHLLLMVDDEQVASCSWYREHPENVSMEDLRIRHCALANQDGWKEKVRSAIESEIDRARRDGIRYAEVGGWAVTRDRRCTSDSLLLALSTYGLCRMLGDALVVTTANVSHCSSAILRRLGGAWLEHDGAPLPAYFDPKYNTNIELVRFDSRWPSPKYLGLIQTVMQYLPNVSVVANPLGVGTAYPRTGTVAATVAAA